MCYNQCFAAIILAVAGGDFLDPIPFIITFPTSSMNDSVACVDIPIIDDEVVEGDHSFIVQGIGADPDGVVPGGPTNATITIQDNDSECKACNYYTYLIT